MPSYMITPQADKDLDSLAQYIALDNINAAMRLYDMAQKTFEDLSQTPLIGAIYKTPHQELQNIRFCSIKEFDRYLVFYKPFNQGIRIIRILHSARETASLLM